MNSLSKSQKIAFIALLAAAIALIVGGVFGVVNRPSASGEQMLSDMRLTALLTTAGEGSKEALIEAEVEAAREAADRAGAAFDRVVELCNLYDSGSELSRLNAKAAEEPGTFSCTRAAACSREMGFSGRAARCSSSTS